MQILFKPTSPHHRFWRNAIVAVFALLLLLFLIRSAAF